MTKQSDAGAGEAVRPLTDGQREYLWDAISAAGVAGAVDMLVRAEVATARAEERERVAEAIENMPGWKAALSPMYASGRIDAAQIARNLKEKS